MSPHLKCVVESKRAFRRELAEKPVGEKLRLVEALSERALSTRPDTSTSLPDAPWQIPPSWRWTRMGEVATIIGGSTPRTDRAEYFGGDIPWITPADLSKYNAKTISRGQRNITKDGLENSGARLLPTGTVLFSSRAPIGYVAIAANPVATNQGFKSFVLGEELTPDFVYYYLQRAKEFAVALASGTTFLEISGKNAARLPVPVPPLDEQRQIVAEIEKQFTRLEAGVAALRWVQANLKRYRATVLKAACEGRLVPTEAEVHRKLRTKNSKLETGAQLLARILTERRQNWQGRGQYKEPAAPDTANLPPLPEGYVWASFGQICRVQGGFAFKSTDYVKEGVPLVRISNLVNGRVQVSEDTVFLPPAFAAANPAFLLRKGDVLIAMSGATTGKMATMEDDIPALLNQRVGRFVLSSEELSNPKFVAYLVMQITQKVLKDAYGAAQPNISPSEIEEMPIPLPPLAEQTRIVAEVERRLSVVEELEAVVTANLQRATRLRQSILQSAFTGGLLKL